MTETKHSPKWRIEILPSHYYAILDEQGYCRAEADSKEDAQLIVNCVNSHEKSERIREIAQRLAFDGHLISEPTVEVPKLLIRELYTALAEGENQ